MGEVLVQWVSPLLTRGNTHCQRFVSSCFIRIFQLILHMALLNPKCVIIYSILYSANYVIFPKCGDCGLAAIHNSFHRLPVLLT